MPTLAPRETFDRHLKKLLDDVLVLGSMVEQAVLDAIESLKRRDLQAAQQVYADDRRINEKRYSIEHECLTLIATQQPMARDLRMIAAILEINTELERMGDYAKGIARINLMLGGDPLVVPLTDLQLMADRGLNMLHRALGAFVARDVEAARNIVNDDDEVDALYNRFNHELIDQVIKDPTKVDRANYLMWAAHNLERLADRVTNICERIVFVVTGEMIEMEVSDDEHLSVIDAS
jgi:phosphate transport system protein